MNLFNLSETILHSGRLAPYKIDCDALNEDDLDCIAFLIAATMKPFSQVEGVPRGGLRLAEALKCFLTEGNDALLIVDDVLTTGTSMEVHRAGREAMGAVIFARGKSPLWVNPLFTLDSNLWDYR